MLDEFKAYDSRLLFRKSEENDIDLITEYFFFQKTHKIGAVSFIWNDKERSFDENPLFTKRKESILNLIKQKFGANYKFIQQPNSVEYYWKINYQKTLVLDIGVHMVLKIYLNP